MLIESYVVEFKEVKKCIAGLDASDFIIVSENVFALSERSKDSHDLLSNLTPNNHPEVLLLVNKEYAKNLLLNEEYFEFVKKSHDIKNLNGVTLHLARKQLAPEKHLLILGQLEEYRQDRLEQYYRHRRQLY